MSLPFIDNTTLYAADLNLLAPKDSPVFTTKLTVGSGVTGFTTQAYTAGGAAALYSTNITPANTNYALISYGSNTFLNATTNTIIAVNNVPVITVTSTGAAVAGTLSSTGALSVAARVLASNTSPTIASGFGASPTVAAAGTAAFKITVGTGGAASGVLTFPTATTGWAVDGECQTNTATTQVVCVATSTTSVTVYAYSRTTGLASTFAAGEVIVLKSLGF